LGKQFFVEPIPRGSRILAVPATLPVLALLLLAWAETSERNAKGNRITSNTHLFIAPDLLLSLAEDLSTLRGVKNGRLRVCSPAFSTLLLPGA
jgi:hypothetical protein